MKNLLIGSAILALMSGTAFADTYVLAMKGPGAGNPFWAAVEAGAMAKGAPCLGTGAEHLPGTPARSHDCK